MSQYTRLRQPATQPKQIVDEERCQQVTAIKSAKELLATPVRSALMAQIKVKANAPPGIYEKFYKDLIEIVAEFYQDLPTFQPPFNRYGGLLDLSLHRASNVLDERKQMRLPEDENATEEQVSEEYALWTYMLFTVALMRDIGKLHNCYFVYLCDSEGLVPRRWQPYDGSMNQQSSYYRFKQIDTDKVKLDPSQWDKRAGPNLAYKLMSSESFNWIHGNAAAYRIWWYELGDEEEEGRGGKGTKNAMDNAETLSLKVAIDLADVAVMEKFVKDAETSIDATENVKNLPALELNLNSADMSDTVQVTFAEFVKAQAESGSPAVQSHGDTVTVQASVVESFSQNFPQAGDANSVYSQISNSTANTANVAATASNTSANTNTSTSTTGANTTANANTNTSNNTGSNVNNNSMVNPAVAQQKNINAGVQAAAAMAMAASQFPAGVEATARSSVTLRAGR